VFSVDPAMRGAITGWDMVGGAHHRPGDPITGAPSPAVEGCVEPTFVSAPGG